MASFNLSRYNLSRYNIPTSENVVTYDKIRMDALFQAQIGLAQVVTDILTMQGLFQAEVSVGAGKFDNLSMSAEFNAQALPNYKVLGHSAISAAFSTEIQTNFKLMGKNEMAAEFRQESYLGNKVRDIGTVQDAVFEAETSLGNKVMNVGTTQISAVFGALIAAESLEEIVLTLDCDIPADSVLLIDSDNFRVLMDEKNAIKYHSGDWIDALSRSTKEIVIEAGGSTFTATIYYQELWL